jgi:hypothetical protein
MNSHLNDEKSIKISEPKTTVIDVVSRNKIDKGDISIRFIGYKGDSSYGGIWLDTRSISSFVSIVEDIEEKCMFDSKYKYRKGFNVSKFSPDSLDPQNCIRCCVCKENMTFDEYSLSISEDYSYMGNHVRVHKDCISRFSDILDIDDYQSEIVSEQLTK